MNTPSAKKKSELRDCVCVQSDFYSTCGGLFYQDVVTTSISGPKMFRKHLLIVSHFIHDLFLLDWFTAGYNIDDITIISKCGAVVYGGPSGSTIV